MNSDVLAKVEERARLQELYRRVFDTDDGRKVLEHMCKTCFAFETTFTPGQPDVTAFKEGQRHLFLMIVRFIERDDLRYVAEILKRTNEQTDITLGPGRG